MRDSVKSGPTAAVAIMALYQAGALATFIYLTFYSGIEYTWWNWLLAVPFHVFFAELWPLYWGIYQWFI